MSRAIISGKRLRNCHSLFDVATQSGIIDMLIVSKMNSETKEQKSMDPTTILSE